MRWTSTALTLCVLLSGCGGGSGPPENPSAPPPTVSAPPPTLPARPVANAAGTNGSGAAPTNPKPVSSPAKPAGSIDAPSEQIFELVDDRTNFAVLSGPAPEHLVDVDESTREGNFVSVEQPAIEQEEITQQLPDGFEIIPGSGVTKDGWPRRIRSTVDGKEMACVPQGLFSQGTDAGSSDASPAHPMSLDTYYIDLTEVTIGEFQQFKVAMSGKEGGPSATVPLTGDPRRPVVKLSWKDAMNYAKWARKELPTEAEWEKAGRGPEGYLYPWGSDRVLWHQPRLPGQIDPVGSYPHDRSQYGVMDLAGNAREWCSDWYADTAYKEARKKDGSPAHNWTGPKKSSNGERVVRGSNERWELWVRGSHGMSKPAEDIGFRCVLRCRPETPKE